MNKYVSLTGNLKFHKGIKRFKFSSMRKITNPCLFLHTAIKKGQITKR